MHIYEEKAQGYAAYPLTLQDVKDERLAGRPAAPLHPRIHTIHRMEREQDRERERERERAESTSSGTLRILLVAG